MGIIERATGQRRSRSGRDWAHRMGCHAACFHAAESVGASGKTGLSSARDAGLVCACFSHGFTTFRLQSVKIAHVASDQRGAMDACYGGDLCVHLADWAAHLPSCGENLRVLACGRKVEGKNLTAEIARESSPRLLHAVSSACARLAYDSIPASSSAMTTEAVQSSRLSIAKAMPERRARAFPASSPRSRSCRAGSSVEVRERAIGESAGGIGISVCSKAGKQPVNRRSNIEILAARLDSERLVVRQFLRQVS